MDKRREFYISLDVETDGPIPIRNSMKSIGAAALGWNNDAMDWEVSGVFYKKLHNLPGAVEDLDTMEFWRKNPEAWKEANADPEDPKSVMQQFRTWCEIQRSIWNRRLVGVCAPVGFAIANTKNGCVGNAKLLGQSSEITAAYRAGDRIRAAVLDFAANLVLGGVTSTLFGLAVVGSYPIVAYRGWIGAHPLLDRGRYGRVCRRRCVARATPATI